jgi:hypothetical protein
MFVLSAARAASAAPTCYINYGGAENAKPNRLYLYFPASNDATYPEFGFSGLTTSPAHKFDPTELTSYTGSAADLRNRITDVVVDDYCEFDVHVEQTTSAPPATFARRNTVAIGTDTDPTASGTFGLAQNVDTGDLIPVDFARVWAGTYQTLYGGSGGALNGANSTLDRWARSIGGTAAHEGGHNFGESHGDGLILGPGEDVLTHHIMASGTHFSGEDRAGYRRHFSDHEYSILASNVGLAIQTVWNWDFVNPNAQTGVKLRISILSPLPSLIVSWFYNGNRSPWINPAVAGPSGTQVFKGTTYNKYTLTWSAGQPWINGSPGQVPGGTQFHVGAGFSSVDFNAPDPIIITDVALLDGSDNPLPLHPRFASYDAGSVDQADGAFNVHFFNVAAQNLIVQNVVVQDLPRVLSLNQMVVGGRMVDPRGRPFRPFSEGVRRLFTQPTYLKRGAVLNVPVARLNQRRYIDEVVDERACNSQDRLKGADTAKCTPGRNVALFPSTTTYITAQVVDPQAKHWDPQRKRYVIGPLASTLFYQIAGRHLPGDPGRKGRGNPGGVQKKAAPTPTTKR